MTIPVDRDSRVARAAIVLEGISVGDAFGERFFRAEARDGIASRTPPPGPWPYTDDTEMSIGVFDTLVRYDRIQQDALALVFAERYRRDPWKGYGGTIRGILRAICDGISWRTLAPAVFNGEGSMGNGSAMRVGVIGGWFADDYARVVEEARLSALVTHAHPDAAAGAIAIAVAVAWMWRNPCFDAQPFFSQVLALTPPGPTHDGIAQAMEMPSSYSIGMAARRLGNGDHVTCSDTVPLCLWLAARHHESYPEALWAAVEAEGDRDTTAAIIGGILASRPLREGIPTGWLTCREPLQHDVDQRPLGPEAGRSRP